MHEKPSVDSPRAREAAGRDGKARKNAEVIREAMQSRTYDELANYAGGSVSLMGRWFGEAADVLGRALAYLGLKVVSTDVFCVSRETYQAYQQLAEEHVMQNRARRRREERFEHVLFEDPE